MTGPFATALVMKKVDRWSYHIVTNRSEMRNLWTVGLRIQIGMSLYTCTH